MVRLRTQTGTCRLSGGLLSPDVRVNRVVKTAGFTTSVNETGSSFVLKSSAILVDEFALSFKDEMVYFSVLQHFFCFNSTEFFFEFDDLWQCFLQDFSGCISSLLYSGDSHEQLASPKNEISVILPLQ